MASINTLATYRARLLPLLSPLMCASVSALSLKPNIKFVAIDDENDWMGFLKGIRCEQPANLIDLFPTIDEIRRLPKKRELEGQGLFRDCRVSRWLAAANHDESKQMVLPWTAS